MTVTSEGSWPKMNRCIENLADLGAKFITDFLQAPVKELKPSRVDVITVKKCSLVR